ncbi:MAG: hypothetical protein RR704_22385 [Stenotrophomonas sp.]
MQRGIGKGALAGGAAIAMLAMMMAAQAGDATASPVSQSASMTTTAPVAGIGLPEWTARWWRWVDAQRVPPYLDPDGRLCGSGQDGPVWNLAGTNGRFQPTRECVVPEGRHLLLPIINMAYFQPDSSVSCQELQAGAAVNNEHLVSAVVLLDGQPLGDMRRHRVKSDGCFHIDPDDDSSPLVAADGYWLMLKPLPRGRHTISVGANYGAPDGDSYSGMRQTFEYVLHVGGATQITAETSPPAHVAAR